MGDRFPVMLLGGLLLLAALGAFVTKGARRGSFADRLSTFRSEPNGARAAFLLLEQDGVPVVRLQTDLTVIDEGHNLALLGVTVGGSGALIDELFASPDGGVDDGLDGRGYQSFLTPSLTDAEVEKLLAHVREGGQLLYAPVALGSDALLHTLGVSLERSNGSGKGLRTLVPAQPSRYTRGVERVEVKTRTALQLPPDAVPLLVDERLDETLLASVPWGQGRVLVLGAPALATNEALGLADNAQLWLSLGEGLAAGGDLAFDEYHHGFTGARSVGAFAARYGLHWAFGQLLLGVGLWALALRRFGRPRPPLEATRLGSTDALFATSRLYREGRHHAHAARVIAREVTAELAAVAGMPPRSEVAEVIRALQERGRPELANELSAIDAMAGDASSEDGVRRVATFAALTRQKLRQPRRSPS